MFRKTMLFASVAMLLILMAMPRTIVMSQVQSNCKPVNGHIISTLLTGPECTSPVGLCTTGRFIGGIHGDFIFTATSLTPNIDTPETGVVHYTGDIVIRTTNGEIQDKDTGAYNGTPGGTGDIGSVSTITGGTGKYAGATGRIRVAGTFTPEEGGEDDYIGFLCTQ